MAPLLDRGEVDGIVLTVESGLVQLRREIHRWPELAGEERRTAALVAEILHAGGLAVSTGVGGATAA